MAMGQVIFLPGVSESPDHAPLGPAAAAADHHTSATPISATRDRG